MLKGLTSTFKNGCNNVEVMYREYLVLGNQTIPIKAELSDDSYENGNFIGTFIFKTIKFETDAQYDFKNKEFEYYKEVNGESVKIGTFITTEVEINDTTEIVKVVGMDYGLKTQIAYRSQLDYSAGNITLLDVWNEACQLSGLESGIDYFPNGDFIVDNDQFTGTGATIRDVFKGIAMSSGSFVKVMNDDKIYLVFNSYTGDTETTTISGSGSIDDGYAIDNLQIEGKAEQEGTPTPDNPEEIKTVSGIGNLLNLDTTSYGYINDSGNVAGTGSHINRLTDYIRFDENMTVSLSTTIYSIGYALFDENKNYLSRVSKVADISKYTISSSSAKYIRIWFNYDSSSDTTIELLSNLKAMIESGTTPHTPVPYGHWLPVKVSNRNLFSGNYSQFDSIGGEGTIYSYFKLPKANTRYTLTVIAKKDFTPTYYTYIGFTGNGGNATAGNRWAVAGGMQTFKKGSTITIDNLYNGRILEYVSLFKNDAQTLETFTEYFDIQVEEGTTATDYIEHQEQTTLIDLNKYDENNNIIGNYELCSAESTKDLLTIKDGRAILNKNINNIMFNGTENWNKDINVDVDVDYFYITDVGINQNNVDNAISNYFIKGTSGIEGFWATRVFCITINKIYTGIISSDTKNGRIDKFKSWLSTHNTEVYYALATPETITLKGTYDINLYEGVNHISIEDELEPTMVMSYYNNNLDIIEDYVELEDKRDTRPWTCLRLGMSQVEGENVDYVDEDLVAKYGENWLILNDNPFAYTQQKRQQLITNIFNRIKEFGYSAFVSKTSFKPYLTAGDIVKFKNREGNLVKTILLRYNHNAEEITLESPSETSATVNYVYPLTDIDLYKRTEIQVDKANNQIRTNVDNIGLLQTSSSSNADNINTLTSLVDGQGKEIERLGTKIVQDVGSINASVTAIQGEIEQGVGLVKTTSVTIDNNGLSVSTDTSKIQTTMTNDTFKIADKGGTELAKFGYDENEGISIAEMDNLTVKNYFVAGVHRVETIEIDGEERTGWFYMGG